VTIDGARSGRSGLTVVVNVTDVPRAIAFVPAWCGLRVLIVWRTPTM
jgi:hypothetical protein